MASSASSVSSEEDVSFFDAMEAGEEANRVAGASPSERLQLNTSIPLQGATVAARRRPQTVNGDHLSTRRNSVPIIPQHLLSTGKRATLQPRAARSSVANKESRSTLLRPSSPVLPIQRPSTSGGEHQRRDSARDSRGHHGGITNTAPPPRPTILTTRRKSFSTIPAHSHEDTLAKLETGSTRSEFSKMNRLKARKNDDLFLELANDQSDSDGARPPSRGERAASRMSQGGKRYSLPYQERRLPFSNDNRPKTSGYVLGNRAPSRLGTSGSDTQRHAERHRNLSSRAGYQTDDAASGSALSSSNRRQRYTTLPEQSASSPARPADRVRSPELPHYGRRRPSFGPAPSTAQTNRAGQQNAKQHDSFSESPAESSEPKQSNPDSASVDSDTADTVWDELDDLKSRIKKLELTGKMPPTSAAAVSGESSERPRTATTAPTTIDSSPKHDKPEKKQQSENAPETQISEYVVGGPSVASIHPTLHGALAKAKPLLSGALYRSLEATAADALQLAAMTGSAGPQGTTFSAAAIINGVTASDRHVRRKADTMCRNLTDLCIALCEGKHDAPSVTASPVTLATPLSNSPSLRYPRSSLGPTDSLTRVNSRPMSRLEARRTSILGSQAGSIGASPIGGDDVSASEQETTPSISRKDDQLRIPRPQSRLQRIRQQHYNNQASDDDDPTIRPPSRAMTDIGRSKPSGPREYSTPQRSPNLRDSLVARRANASAYEGNRELSRVASLNSESGRTRRFLDPSTPPVLEEEDGGEGQEYRAVSTQASRRVMSLNRHAPRSSGREREGRVASLAGRRAGVAVE
ncbi:uncharacterized protein LTR77_002604 [Saxophila tyrrhenica]|uniref:Uncharacterized protein n=1 Tax=Saxophila tyrrhenica TaxID=1690608 RepID=A0AAV9PMK4_9PEZI|nr:hypothetical protein LTR77_002604 [Saxophila tyrrhenica]